ncbi:CubicO group peptidase, beta-lactamase class C family [Andreprevotia lacus DSM 23236]|jgi:CubicO group peptidase (beta-lactamase class C family)|uniref:CubicO group peptidase, beta-lactamase class C family n=1 Tax=Andreprevotia lacus DSM 23236 TaxID=1121001 RepID=A0A1W1Y164_9NEIS|nr:serine hydrolase domain-containing protein [Andreprevotia lacus]SMC29877.1 CubicO group peptidase, beta-lactamase class C family [Andreprevotia lacus DSM 23236]
MRFTFPPIRKPRLASAVALLLACLLPLCVEAAPAAPSELQQSIARRARAKHVCAVAYATVQAGQLADSGGASGCEPGFEPAADSVFQAASLSKPVFAYAVLKLAQEGMLDLDTPLVHYLPQGYLHVQNTFAFGQPPVTDRVAAPELQAVTARMLLQHTAGLPNWSDGALAFDFPPGSSWQYSGEGYVLLQRVLESITHQTLDDLMQQRVFAPLGMRNSAFRWQPRFAPAFVPGMPRYMALPEALAPLSLHTSARDYATFLAALLADRQLLQQITQAPAPVQPGLGLAWGLGWGIEHGEQDTYLWQWGNNPGYRAFAMASVNTGDAVVILTNSEDGLTLAEPAVNSVLPGTHNVFKSWLIREGLSHVVCKQFNWCF